MAIKVIKQGKDPDYDYVTKCPYCGSILRYKITDTQTETPVATWHEPHMYCPVCNALIGHNTQHTEKKELYCPGKTLYYNTFCSALVPDGCEAYGLYLNGNVIELHKIDTLIPSGLSVLIIGNATEIELTPGVTDIDRHIGLRRIRLADMTKDEFVPEYYTISDDLQSFEKITDNKYQFGIHPVDINNFTTIQKFDD